MISSVLRFVAVVNAGYALVAHTRHHDSSATYWAITGIFMLLLARDLDEP